MSPPPASLRNSCQSSGSRAPSAAFRTLGGRYNIAAGQLIGEGGFAEVYRGRDTETGDSVAVKLYTVTDDEAVEHFQHTINIWNKISDSADMFLGKNVNKDGWNRQESCNHDAVLQELQRSLGAVGAGADRRLFQELVARLDIRRCFAQVKDYSLDDESQPGVESGTGLLWIVQELGAHSLEDEIVQRREQDSPMDASELFDLLWSLVCITWGLHVCGFVHMDIKPTNIVRCSTGDEDEPRGQKAMVEWKLIDLDGAMPSQQPVRAQCGKLCFTPIFMSPELAAVMVNNESHVVPSRMMDVWSVGMCVMEAIFQMPVLQPWYDQWAEETGSEEKFYRWLGASDSEPIIHGDMEQHIRSIHPGLCDVLQGMFRKDPTERSCAARCLMHQAFSAHRAKLLTADSALQALAEDAKKGWKSQESQGSSVRKPRIRSSACSVM